MKMFFKKYVQEENSKWIHIHRAEANYLCGHYICVHTYICIHTCVSTCAYVCTSGASLIAELVKNPPSMQETPVQFLGREDLLEKG